MRKTLRTWCRLFSPSPSFLFSTLRASNQNKIIICDVILIDSRANLAGFDGVLFHGRFPLNGASLFFPPFQCLGRISAWLLLRRGRGQGRTAADHHAVNVSAGARGKLFPIRRRTVSGSARSGTILRFA